ncbi:MAG TPA: MarR family transcriptional regulator [Alphaproteobacteria bacterium]|nr:MarR family transcriptional regulator [Alphaproteobacteria bacterium]
MSLDWDRLTPFRGPEDSPGFLLWQVTNLWQRRLRAALAPHGLTHVQFVLLAGLGWLERIEAGAPVTQAGLAAFCKTDAMMTSQVLRALEAEGLVARRRHPTDSRARALTLTAAGRGRLEAALPAVEAADAAFFGALAARDGDFLAGLRRLWGGAVAAPG